MALDPEDPRIVYISSNAANPADISQLDNVPLNPEKRYEIWRGFTADGGLTFSWQPVTRDSAADNLRPIVPENHNRTRHLLGFFGRYTTYTNYNARVIGIFDELKTSFSDWQAEHGLAGSDPGKDSDGNGLPDLVEYAFGADPKDPRDRPMPTLTGNAVSLPHFPARTDIQSIVEVSTDFMAWTPVATVRAGYLPNEVAPEFTLHFEPVTPGNVTLSPPSNTSPRLFFRVKVDLISMPQVSSSVLLEP